MLIEEVMKRPFVVDKNISLAEAAKIMSANKIGCLIFVSGSKVKGIITEGDIVRNFGKKEKISQAMKTKVITIKPEDTLDEALELMRNNKIKRLPVVENNNLVGVITLTDILAKFETLEGDFFFE